MFSNCEICKTYCSGTVVVDNPGMIFEVIYVNKTCLVNLKKVNYDADNEII